MSRPLIIITVLVVLLILIACGVSGAIYYARNFVPTQQVMQTVKAEQKMQTATAEYSFNTTATSQSYTATWAAALTRAAIPTDTLTPTITFTPTITPTSTPVPSSTVAVSEIKCESIMTRDDTLFPLPGRGTKNTAIGMLKSAKIDLVGRLYDGDWYLVEFNGGRGWVSGTSVDLPAGCKPNNYDLSHMLNLLNRGQMLILDETFGQNRYAWTDNRGESVAPVSNGTENILRISASSEVAVFPNIATESLSEYDLFMSARLNKPQNDGYFGIRFLDNGNTNSEILIIPFRTDPQTSCQVLLRVEGSDIAPKKLKPILCGDGWYDISLSVRTNKIELVVNGSELISYDLNDVGGSYRRFAITVNDAELDVSHVVIVKP